ncbi:MAG: MOSC domain-containing protein [Gemmatimonadetes bacterium]|nr:MOSC domain-containing protein [Gemmatimonadota bacterium]
MELEAGPGSRVVGRVVGLWRYPVKSMAGEALESAEVGWHGVEGDRRWAFVREGMVRSGFPWLTIRENPRMWGYQPRLADPGRPNASVTLVRTPSGAELDVTDPALAEELGHGARVLRQDRGIFDTFPLSLITTQTITALGEMAGSPLDARRFRPNLLVDASGGEPFPEDAWVGAVLTVGGLRMRIDKRDQRCVMIDVDPATTERNTAVLRAVARERQGCLGVYGTTVQPGRVSIGDVVTAG